LPAVTTRLAAIPEIIRDVRWFSCAPGTGSLIAALQHLILDPALRLRQGQAAEQLVRQISIQGARQPLLTDEAISAESRSDKYRIE